MTGGRNLVLKTPNIEYNVYLRNKYTLLLGDSATGKTAFRDFLLETVNSSSVMEDVYELQSDFDSVEVIYNESSLVSSLSIQNRLCVVDENLIFIVKKYLEEVRKSNCFFLFITREVDLYLNYGIYDVLTLKTKQKDDGTFLTYTDIYADFKECVVSPDICITEDSKSGYEFFRNTLNVECISAKSKTRVPKMFSRYSKMYDSILIIVDEVGFGYEFYLMYRRGIQLVENKLYMWCPYSFEYMLLNSGLFFGKEFSEFLENPFKFCNFSKNSTIEVFIEKTLVDGFKKIGYEYFKGCNVFNIKDFCIQEIYARNLDNFNNLLGCNKHSVKNKVVNYSFIYMYKNEEISKITVYMDESVTVVNYTDEDWKLPFLFDNVSRDDVNMLLKGRVFDEGRPDKDDLLRDMGVPFYDPLMIVRKTRGVMIKDYFWLKFFEEDTWELATQHLKGIRDFGK